MIGILSTETWFSFDFMNLGAAKDGDFIQDRANENHGKAIAAQWWLIALRQLLGH